MANRNGKVIPHADMLTGNHGSYLCFYDGAAVSVRVVVDQFDGDVISDVPYHGDAWQSIAALQILAWEAALQPVIWAKDPDRDVAWRKLTKHKKYTGIAIEFYVDNVGWVITCSSPRYKA